MTPLRWLAMAGVADALYIVFIWASARDGEWDLPPQANSIILAALSVATVIPAVAAIVTRAFAKISAPTPVRSADYLDAYARGYADGLARKPMESSNVSNVVSINGFGS